MNQPVILDTGPLVALLNRRDAYHDWVMLQIKSLNPPLLTCEAVITEACFLSCRDIGGTNAVIELAQNGFMKVSFHFDDEMDTIKELMVKYANVPMSFADACLVRMAEQYPNSAVLTLDRDFWVYRKHGNQVIPVIMPDVH
ncbi:MAG: pilus assembly protein [Candidatus Parabeggiatoa sp. nov. 1]|nr:MAG: pilus assembly protein [Gammaproteobacteria bacterium]